MMGPSENQYEEMRAHRIAANAERLRSLGILQTHQCNHSTTRRGSLQAPPLKKTKASQPPKCAPRRSSSRLQTPSSAAVQTAAAATQPAAPVRRPRLAFTEMELGTGPEIEAPFTLRSIGVTVWDLGCIHRAAWADRYWSSPGCLYHHAYPVGYRASKTVFGREYEMSIGLGEAGPVFKIRALSGPGQEFEGPTPTQPWTAVCLAHRTGQRISGPQYFGFSDALTQRAIAGLYDARELAAALKEGTARAEELCGEERAVREFVGLPGVGRGVATSLALTEALGGRRHTCLRSLRAWARQEGTGHAQQLEDWLRTSSELPGSTLRWPAWQLRIVPGLMRDIAGAHRS
ncbi:hypothetical protein ACKKBF_B37855 [Auxenochlorella protothecoides x Auxenochlorella symbiontica]